MSTTDDSKVVTEPPDDDVEIGESPDGDRLNGDQARWLLTNRRSVLVALGSIGSIAAIAEADLGGSDGGNLYGGTMALEKAYKIGPRTYGGPDSIKDSVISEIPDDEGWEYHAYDTDVDYYLDNNTWEIRNIGSQSKPVSVYAESLPNVYDHVVGDSEQLAAALDDAEANAGVSIKLGNATFTPFQYKSDTSPWELKGGTVIHGQHPGDPSWDVDRLEATEGSIIDAGGNRLFRVDAQTGLDLKNFGVKNWEHVLISGRPLGHADGWEYGIAQSNFKNIAACNGTDYAVKLYNWQRLRMDKVIVSNAPGHTYGVASNDVTFQPGNSEWSDLHCSPDGDNSLAPFYLEARDYSINYITTSGRIQVINAGGDGTNAAMRLEGNTANNAAVNGCEFQGVDLEGSYEYYVDMVNVNNCRIHLKHNDNAAADVLRADSDCTTNYIENRDGGTGDINNPLNELAGRWDGFTNDDGFGIIRDDSQSEVLTLLLGNNFNGNRRVQITDGELTFTNRGVNAQGLRTEDSGNLANSPGTRARELRFHNGNDGNPIGYYWWDADGLVSANSWIRVSDNATTITP